MAIVSTFNGQGSRMEVPLTGQHTPNSMILLCLCNTVQLVLLAVRSELAFSHLTEISSGYTLPSAALCHSQIPAIWWRCGDSNPGPKNNLTDFYVCIQETPGGFACSVRAMWFLRLSEPSCLSEYSRRQATIKQP